MNTPVATPPQPNFIVPVAHRLYELYKLFHGCLIRFPKHERYTLGNRIEILMLDSLELALGASYAPRHRKLEYLQRASDKVDVLKYTVRLACEIKAMTPHAYGIIGSEVVIIGKELGKWIKSIR